MITLFGINAKSSLEIKRDLEQIFKSSFGDDLNLDSSTPQGQLITSLTEIVSNQTNAIVKLYNAFVNGGDGNLLDNYAKTFFGLTRNPEKKGSITVTISGTPGTSIPVDFACSDGHGHQFITTSSYNIASNGSVTVNMEQNYDEDFIVNAMALNTIDTPKEGVERIVNTLPSIKPIKAETDTELRLRIKNSLSFRSKAIFSGLISRLRELHGVQKVGGYENYTSEDETVKGTLMKANSINCVVKGGDLNEIGKTIKHLKNPGCYVGGDIIIDVYDDEIAENYTMRVYRPKNKNLKARVEVKINSLVNQDYAEQLKEQLKNYIASYEFGSEIVPFEVATIINVNNLVVKDFKMTVKKELEEKPLSYDVIKLDFTDEAVLDVEDIEVVRYE